MVRLNALVARVIANAAAPLPPAKPAPAKTDVYEPKNDSPRQTDGTCELDRLPDPAAAAVDAYEGKRSYAHVPLFKDGIAATDVYQGALANCYVAGAFSAVAQADSAAIASMFRANGDGTWSVRFYRFDPFGRAKAEWIKVDADLYGDDNPLYGKVKGELWYALAEKAFAEFNGSYGKIGKGGSPSAVMEAITGERGAFITYAHDDDRWNAITRKLDANKPVALVSPKDDADGRFKMSELSNWHCYAIVGYETDDMGERWVYVRNPWGATTAPDSDGTMGISRIPLSTLSYFFGTSLYTIS